MSEKGGTLRGVAAFFYAENEGYLTISQPAITK